MQVGGWGALQPARCMAHQLHAYACTMHALARATHLFSMLSEMLEPIYTQMMNILNSSDFSIAVLVEPPTGDIEALEAEAYGLSLSSFLV